MADKNLSKQEIAYRDQKCNELGKVSIDTVIGFDNGFIAGLEYQGEMLAILKTISDKITNTDLDFAGPSGLIHVPLSRAEIDAIRAAFAQSEGVAQ